MIDRDRSKSIAIVGHGYVGKAMANLFRSHYDLIIIDNIYNRLGILPSDIPYKQSVVSNNYVTVKDDELSSTYTDQYDYANGCKLVVISLPTQPREDGSCDTSLVENALESIDAELFLIKSTVSPGTTEKLRTMYPHKRIVFSPEFCGESKYWSPYAFDTDVKETPWFIFGGHPKDTERMVEIFIKIVGPTKTYHQTDATTAEVVKYIENTFYALKVTFCYEVNEICKHIGVDYYKVRDAWLLDPRINPMHTAVFAESGNPYGGKCVTGNANIKVKDINSENYKIYSIKDYFNYVNNLKDSGLPFSNEIESVSFDMSNSDTKIVNDVTCRNINEDIFVFETDVGTFECTSDHLLPVFRDGKILLLQAKNIKETDELFSKIGRHFPAEGEITDDIDENLNRVKINSISKRKFIGKVYNLHIESNDIDPNHDDLYWIEHNTGIITHNCFVKDVSAIAKAAEAYGYDAKLIKEIMASNDRIGGIRESRNNT